jgi:hypothetical protein
MADKPAPLHDEQIRALFKEFNRQITEYGADTRVLELALLRKGVLTETDISEARKQVVQEMGEQVAKIAAALQTKPPDTLQ